MAVPIWNNNSKSFQVQSKPEVKDRIEVLVGDDKDPSVFHPQMKMQRWDNESNVSFRLVHDFIPGNVSYSEENGVITWKKKQGRNEWIARFYEDWGTPEGAYKFVELVLPAKPPTNQISFTTQSKDVDFFYQPALTQQEIDDGGERPENVVGSYAIYSKSSGGINRIDGKEYKTGKVGHLYRAYLEDTNGDRTWAEYNTDLNETGILTITVDQTWLDNAVYPVVLDPTFGYTTIGGSEITNASDSITTTNVNLSVGSDGIVDSVSAYVRHTTGSAPLGTQTAIYDSSGNLLSSQSETKNVSSTSAYWETWNFTGGPSVSSGSSYYPAVFADNTSSNRHAHYYDSATSGPALELGETYNTWPDPASWFNQGRKHSIYATYTASGTDADPTLSTNTGTLALSTPTVTATTNVTVNASTQELTSSNPTNTISVGDSVTPATIETTLTPESASVTGDANITAGLQELTSSNPTTTQSGDANVTAGTVTINQTYVLPSYELTSGAVNVTVNEETTTLTFTASSPTVSASGNVTVNEETTTATLEALAPTITTTSSVSYSPDTQTTTLTLNSPTVTGTASVTGGTQEGTLALLSPSVLVADSTSPSTNTTTLTALAPTVTGTASVSAGTQTLTSALLAPTIEAGGAYTKNAPLYYEIGGGLSMMLGAPKIPVWTTAGRPSSPSIGLTGLNRETGEMETYDGTAWVDSFTSLGCYGGIYVANSSTAQTISTGTTYTKLTCYTNNGLSANCTPDAANDKITITKTGVYKLDCSISFYNDVGSNNVEWKISPFLDGTIQEKIQVVRKVAAATDRSSATLSGLIDVTSSNLDLDIRTVHDNGSDVDITVEYSNLNINYIGRT